TLHVKGCDSGSRQEEVDNKSFKISVNKVQERVTMETGVLQSALIEGIQRWKKMRDNRCILIEKQETGECVAFIRAILKYR
ncbi:hypothetical protein C0J52_02322, partial [Blattella germanica]